MSTLLAGCISLALFQQTERNYKNVSAQEALELIKRDSMIVLLDVRTPGEFTGSTGHLNGAVLMPIQELDRRVGELDSLKSRTIIAVCRSGNRSGRAAAFLNKRGSNVVNLEGGMMKWSELRLPVIVETH